LSAFVCAILLMATTRLKDRLHAAFSAFFFHGMRFYFRLGYQLLRRQKSSASWQLLTERLELPFALPYIMLNAPRWNTHALIATIGPIRIKGQLKIDTAGLSQAGKSVTLVLYRQPSNESILLELSPDRSPISLDLEPANYLLTCRVYEPHFPLKLPAVWLDEEAVPIPRRELTSKPDYYPPEIWNQKGGWYRFWHFHLLHRFRQLSVPSAKLQKAYLPVGNPQTVFLFGYLPANHSLNITVPDSLQDRCLVYLTCYNDSSFPFFSALVPLAANYQTPMLTEEGSWLLRVIPLGEGLWEEEVRQAVRIGLDEY
jgi:hypothetical protein